MNTNNLEQTNPERRNKLKRSNGKLHMLTASACMKLARAQSMTLIDNGLDDNHLKEMKTKQSKIFNPNHKQTYLGDYHSTNYQ